MAKLIAARLFAVLASLALVLGVSATASAQTTQRLDIDWDKSGQTSEAPGRYEFNVTVNNYRAVLKRAYILVQNTGTTTVRTTKATLRVNGQDKLSVDATATTDPYYYTLAQGESFEFTFNFPVNAVDLYEGDNVQFVVESPDGGELSVYPLSSPDGDWDGVPLWIEGTVTPWKVIEPTEPTLKASRCGVPKTVVLPRQAYVSYTQTIEGNTATVVAKPDTFHGYVFADDAKEKKWEFDITPEDCDDSQPQFYVESFGSIKIQNQGTSENSPFVTKVQVPEAAKFQRAVVKITSPEAINSIIAKLEIDKMDPNVNIDRRLITGALGEKYLEIEFFPTQNGQRVESASIPDDTLLTFTTNIAKLPGVVVDIEIYGESDVYSPNPTPIDKDSDVPAGHARVVVQVGGDRYLSSNRASDSNTGVTMVEGRRPSVQKYTPQAGAKLQLFFPLNDEAFGDEEANTQFTANETGELVRREWATCVSDDDGQCIFDIPVNEEAAPYYWVAMTQASPGFDIQETMRVGGSGDDQTVLGMDLKYAYPTPHLQEGVTYYSGKNYSSPADGPDGSDKANSTYESLVGQLTKDGTASFMYEQNSGPRLWHNRSSFGVMQQVRQNPPMPNRCGLRVGFLVDVSGSMRDPGIKKTQGVLKHVVNELNGTGTQMGMVAFNRLASAQVQNQLNNPNAGESYEILEPTSNKGRLDSWITGLNVFAAQDGFFTPRTTNWEGALSRMAEYNDAHNTSKYDVVYMITDGNPTYLEIYNDARPKNSGGNSTEMRHVEAAIGVANKLKSQGTRVVPIGIPSAWPDKESGTGEQQLVVSAANLEALSGKNPDGEPTESLREWNYATYVDNELLARALANSINTCAITVERRFYPGTEENPPVPTADNTRPTIKESAAWNFNAKLTPTSGQEHEASKAPVAYAGRDNLIAEFKLNGTSDYSKVEIREPEDKIPAGWVRMDAGANGERAQCFDANGSSVSVSSLNAEKTNDFSVGSSTETIPMKGGYHCIVYYRPLPAPDSFNLKLTKVDYEKQTDSLDGASFALTSLGTNSEVEVKECPEVANSCFFWEGLQPGRYQLIETKTPVGGYSLLPKPVFFRVAIENGASKLYILANAEDTEGKDASTVNAFPIVRFDVDPSTTGEYQIALTVANTKIGDLPKTGGVGIWGFAAAGLLICGVAAAVAVRRK